MKVNENVRKEREAILKARREDIRRRKAERERNESAEAIKVEHKRNERLESIKAEKERIIREREELEKTIEEMRKRERIRKQQEELRKIERKEKERKERIKSIKIIIAVICALGSITFISYILDPVGFVEFFKTVGSIIVLIITGIVVKFVSSMPHYTTPHRYIVQDEINKNYKVEKGWHTTTFVPKDRR